MSGLPGLFTGAGLSHLPPAGLPLATTFQRRLAEACYRAARTVAPDLVDEAHRDAVATGPCNLLARLHNTRASSGSGAVRSLKVTLPSEAHVLAALHLALGGFHVTVNFDEGVERAYELLAGRATLPEDAPADYHDALPAWRRCVPAPMPALRVAWTASGLASTDFAARPLLVKLNGSMARDTDGVALPATGAPDEADATELGRHRTAALDALTREDFVVVTGYSGADHVCYAELVKRLRVGRFLWMAPSVRPDVRATVKAIDPGQPLAGQPADAIRRHLPFAPPSWPSAPATGSGFEQRFEAWSAGLAPEVGTAAFAWALADIGRVDAAIGLFERLGNGGRATARTRLRLAEALVTRDGDGDRRRAARMFLVSTLGKGTGSRQLRSYAGARWAECLASRGAPLPAMAVAALAGPLGGDSTARSRSTSAVVGIVLGWLERRVPAGSGSAGRTVTRWLSARCASSAQRVIATTDHAPGGRRRALVRRQAIELSALVALLGGPPLPRASVEQLDWLKQVYDHLGDDAGVAATLGTRALASLAAGEPDAARRTLEQAMLAPAATTGVVALVRGLLDGPACTASDRRPASALT